MSLAVHPMSSASPDLSDDSMTALRESIRTLGQLVPIVVWRGEVIDGRKRLACCEALGVEPITVELADDANATDQAGALNLLRTHYTVSQRAMYASKLARLPYGGASRHRDRNSELKNVPTHDEVAAMVDVHPSLISKARQIRRDAEPDVVDAVERGEISLHAASKIAERPRDEQSRLTRQVVAEKGGRRNIRSQALGTARPRMAKAKPAADILSRLFTAIEDNTRILADYLDAPLPDAATQAAWAETLDRILPPLRRMRRRLQGGSGA